MKIRQAAPDEPGAIALLSASHELMRSLFPAETNHFLSVEALKAEGITFFSPNMAVRPSAAGRSRAGGIMAR